MTNRCTVCTRTVCLYAYQEDNVLKFEKLNKIIKLWYCNCDKIPLS